MSDTVIHTLLVEDNPGDARLVREMLRDEGAAEFDLVHVSTARDAVERLLTDPDIDAVLLDLSLPDEQGLDTVRRVVGAGHRAVVVVMTGAGDEQLGRHAMQEGAQDYLVKGQVDGRSLRRAVRFALERQSVRLQLRDQSLSDDLTGLHNRRGFLLLAEQHLKLTRRNGNPFLLLFMDLDRLKYINDTFGHAEGDRAIIEAADVLRSSFRQSDVIARLGGDEFAAMAVGSDESAEAAVRARLDEALRSANAKPDRAYPLAFSVGVLPCAADDTTTVEVLLQRADTLMYEEKRTRTGQSAGHGAEDVSGPPERNIPLESR